MQLQWVTYFMQRLLFGTSQAYVKQLEKGEGYEYLNPVYGLGLLASTFDQETEDWYHHYKIINTQRPEREIKGLQLIFVEIPKFKPKTITEKKLQVLWLRFMSEVNEKARTVDPELLAVDEIREAIALAEESAYSAGELAAYEQYWDAVSTTKTLFYGKYEEGLLEGQQQGRQQGLAQGIQQGIQQGEAAILLRLLAYRFGDIPSHYQQQVIQASTEQLLQWSDRVLTSRNLEEIFAPN